MVAPHTHARGQKVSAAAVVLRQVKRGGRPGGLCAGNSGRRPGVGGGGKKEQIRQARLNFFEQVFPFLKGRDL
tara:strand:+ start:24270 stop:24488 length:219 start_codon:yes stop_codon:yes gene_type:complete